MSSEKNIFELLDKDKINKLQTLLIEAEKHYEQLRTYMVNILMIFDEIRKENPENESVKNFINNLSEAVFNMKSPYEMIIEAHNKSLKNV
ncbi:MAG: hypothetical protein JHC26_08540 [Thermofilum sp.]|uniref:hypothetical protein n=1 Tax=Thermofilum sp. TaxID=1961369 RepID=UPI0025838066|nr:hypothetical protein [Thermofilum sp.]MCI4409124.1 hypothetical protein [Thermofilum sp.]